MTSFQNCYSDSTQCGGSSQAENDSIHSETRVMFEPFINSGTFTLGELTSVSRLSYQVVYQ